MATFRKKFTKNMNEKLYENFRKMFLKFPGILKKFWKKYTKL